MIKLEGYKAFRGVLRVTPKCNITPFNLTGVFFYEPEYKCWYYRGRSYPEVICEVVREMRKRERQR